MVSLVGFLSKLPTGDLKSMIAVDRYLPDMKMSHIKQDKKTPDEVQLPLALRDYYEKLSILMERNAYGLYFFKKCMYSFPFIFWKFCLDVHASGFLMNISNIQALYIFGHAE